MDVKVSTKRWRDRSQTQRYGGSGTGYRERSPCPDPPYRWVCDPSRHRFVETFTSLAFASLSNDLPIMMPPTAIKLVLSCLWYRNAFVSTNMFSDCRNLIALKPINLRWIVATKCASSETVQSCHDGSRATVPLLRYAPLTWQRYGGSGTGYHDGHPLPRVCLREPGSRDDINQWRYVIRAQMICHRNNSYLHDVPECLLVKNCPTPPGLPIPVANKIQKQ